LGYTVLVMKQVCLWERLQISSKEDRSLFCSKAAQSPDCPQDHTTPATCSTHKATHFMA